MSNKNTAEATPAGYVAKGTKKKEGKKVLRRIEIEVLDSGYKVEKSYKYEGKDQYDYQTPAREEHALTDPEEVVEYVANCLGVDIDKMPDESSEDESSEDGDEE